MREVRPHVIYWKKRALRTSKSTWLFRQTVLVGRKAFNDNAAYVLPTSAAARTVSSALPSVKATTCVPKT